AKVRIRLGAEEPQAAFVLLAGPDPAVALRALEAIRQRSEQALSGVPEETRDPLPEGRTRYSRPLPGRHRMYPETDVPPLRVPADLLASVRQHLPERPASARARLEREHGLSAELAHQLVRDGEVDVFDLLRAQGHPPALVAPDPHPGPSSPGRTPGSSPGAERLRTGPDPGWTAGRGCPGPAGEGGGSARPGEDGGGWPAAAGRLDRVGVRGGREPRLGGPGGIPPRPGTHALGGS
ncbi:Glutamyl-tRNA(Gln) amidotransferase, subunit B/E, central region domain protein, partial [mine drainage metagenome]